jgi:hypothetical protein
VLSTLFLEATPHLISDQFVERFGTDGRLFVIPVVFLQGELLTSQVGHSDIEVHPIADLVEPGFPSLPGQIRRYNNPSHHGEEWDAASRSRSTLGIHGFDANTVS